MMGAVGLFGSEGKFREKAKEAQIGQLYRHIRRLKAEGDFLAQSRNALQFRSNLLDGHNNLLNLPFSGIVIKLGRSTSCV